MAAMPASPPEPTGAGAQAGEHHHGADTDLVQAEQGGVVPAEHRLDRLGQRALQSGAGDGSDPEGEERDPGQGDQHLPRREAALRHRVLVDDVRRGRRDDGRLLRVRTRWSPAPRRSAGPTCEARPAPRPFAARRRRGDRGRSSVEVVGLAVLVRGQPGEGATPLVGILPVGPVAFGGAAGPLVVLSSLIRSLVGRRRSLSAMVVLPGGRDVAPIPWPLPRRHRSTKRREDTPQGVICDARLVRRTSGGWPRGAGPGGSPGPS